MKLSVVLIAAAVVGVAFNMTQQLKQEDRFLPYCYNNKEMVIEALKDFCNSIYGGPVDLVLAGRQLVFGDDSEQCIAPQIQHCTATTNQSKMDDFIQSLEIWNAANCSTRDICTPINETGKMPP